MQNTTCTNFATEKVSVTRFDRKRQTEEGLRKNKFSNRNEKEDAAQYNSHVARAIELK